CEDSCGTYVDLEVAERSADEAIVDGKAAWRKDVRAGFPPCRVQHLTRTGAIVIGIVADQSGVESAARLPAQDCAGRLVVRAAELGHKAVVGRHHARFAADRIDWFGTRVRGIPL